MSTILTTRQAKGVVIDFPRSNGRVLSSARHELQTYRRPLGWWVREAITLAALGGCVWTLIVWALP